jgi:hypothetical protein
MHRSSDTIATLAAALARAQIDLTNPEKSLIATIRSPFPREADRTFRYAPLSSGLDIVRKSLGRYEIATIQATGIDREAGPLRLTTVLAHSSGEWISSDWPVCQISDIASAQRVGAALTYARRYALFTLVGIAGEDDLDAPDLGAEPSPSAPTARPSGLRKQEGNGQHAGAQAPARRGKLSESSARTILGTQLSASLRESLIGQLPAIKSPDDAAAWALRNLPAKNTLTTADAKMVEEQFQARLSTFSDSLDADEPAEARAVESIPDAGHKTVRRAKKQSGPTTVQALRKTVRLRDKQHRKYVLRQPCLVCGRAPSDPHHLTFTQPRALGRRVSDEFIVPICRVHHRDLHRSGDEAAWWRRLNIDPLPVALKLWKQTRSENELAPTPQIPDPNDARPAMQNAPSKQPS